MFMFLIVTYESYSNCLHEAQPALKYQYLSSM